MNDGPICAYDNQPVHDSSETDKQTEWEMEKEMNRLKEVGIEKYGSLEWSRDRQKDIGLGDDFFNRSKFTNEKYTKDIKYKTKPRCREM